MKEYLPNRGSTALKLILVMALGVFLLSFGLGANDLFEDEVMGLAIATGSFSDVVLQALRDVHPPLYFLLLHYWTAFWGVSELSARSLSVLFAVLSIWLTYALAGRIFSRRSAFFSALLVAVSPYIIFYGRLARYYSMVMFLLLLSVFLLERACRRGTLIRWLAYALSSIALLYTNYIGLFALAGGVLYAAWKGRRRMLEYIAALVCILLAFLPLVPWMLSQSQGYGLEAGPAGPGRFVADVVGKSAFAFYALCLGETVLFWKAVVVLPALALFAYLFIYGLRDAILRKNEGWRVWLTFCLVPFAGIAILSSMSFVGVFSARSAALFPARVVMLAPLAYMVIACGLCRLSFVKRFALCAVAGGIFLYSLANLYCGREYLNEKYVSPWREVAGLVRSRSSDSDFIASRERSFWFYHAEGDIERMALEAGMNMGGSEPEMVWIVERMRGDTSVGRIGVLSPDFDFSYRLSGVHSFQTLGERKRKMYSRFRGREVGGHYIEVRVYERADRGESSDKKPE